MSVAHIFSFVIKENAQESNAGMELRLPTWLLHDHHGISGIINTKQIMPGSKMVNSCSNLNIL